MARNFDGSDDKVVISDSATVAIGAGNFSVGCWFNADVLSGIDVLFEKGANTDHDLTCAVFNDGTFMYVGFGGQNVDAIAISYAAETWHYLMFCRPSGQNVLVYIDDMTTSVATRVGANNADNGNNMVIGGSESGQLSFLDGKVANFIMYDRGLTEAERIQCKAGCPVPTSGLMAYLPLIGAADPEPDLSGNGNTGVVTGATQSDHPPGIGYCTTLGGAVPAIGGIHPIYPIFNT